jgi:hypothetical protein
MSEHTHYRKQLQTWLTLASVLAALIANAQTSWKGTTSSSWATSANWTAGVPTASMDAVIGDANFTGTYQPSLTASGTSGACRSLTLGAGSKACTLTVSRSLMVSGNLTIGVNGRLAHTSTSRSRVISLTGNWTNSGAYAGSSSSSSVTFSGVTQTIAGSVTTGFRRLNIGASSTTALAGNVNLTNALAVSGTLDPGPGAGFVVYGPGTLSVGNGGKLLVHAATFAGNYSLTGSRTLSSGSTVNYTGPGNQTVDATLTYRTLRIGGGGVKALTGNLPTLNASSSTQGNLYVDAATFDISLFKANRGTSRAGGTLVVAGGATLRIGGTQSFPANYATHTLAPTSTVEYYGTNQTVTAEAYGHLTLSSAGNATKTLPPLTLTVGGNLTSKTNAPGASVSFTAAAACNAAGSVSLGAGTTFNAGSFSHAVAGNWTNSGTFVGGTSTVSFTGANTRLTGSGTNGFFNVVFAQPGIVADANTSLSVAGNLSTTGPGSFTHTPGGAGMVNMTGTSKSLSGTALAFSKLVIAGTTTTASSFTAAGDLLVNGALTATAGTIALSGTGKTLSGTGTMQFSGLSVPGSITTSSSFAVAGDVNVTGNFTALSGVCTCAGSTTFSGTATLSGLTLNGRLLRLGTGSVLRLSGKLALVAGEFDALSQRPNTVVYAAATDQPVYPTTYDNLELARGGIRSASGTVDVRGSLTIAPDATFLGGSSGHRILVQTDWLNYGSFTAGNSTVEFAGSANSKITGKTSFHLLRVNKSASSVLVHLVDSLTTATLDMASGTLDTGTSALTLTSTRTGNGHILGTITRQHAFAAGVAYAFESPWTTVTFDSVPSISAVTVSTATGPVADFPSGAAINRQYELKLSSSGTYSATLRLYYEDAELNGNHESGLSLWRSKDSAWVLSGESAQDTAANWVENRGVSELGGRWTLSGESGVVRWAGSVSSAWEAAGNWTVVSGSASRPPSGKDVVELGTARADRQPVVSSAVSVSSISFGSALPMTVTLGPGASLNTSGNISGTWASNVSHTINVGSGTLRVGGDLVLSDGLAGHVINVAASSGTIGVAANLVQSGEASITLKGSSSLNLEGSFRHLSGEFSAGEGSVYYLGNGAQVVGAVQYNTLVFKKPSGVATFDESASVSGDVIFAGPCRIVLNADVAVAGGVSIDPGTTLDLGGKSISVGGNWVCDGKLDILNGGTVNLYGSGAQSIGPCAFHALDIEKPSGTATLGGDISVVARLDIRSGTLDLGAQAVNKSVDGAVLAVGAGASLRTAGTFPSGFASVSLAPESTVEYHGTLNQEIAAVMYGHLALNNGANNPKSLTGPTTVAGDLSIARSATLAAGVQMLTVHGDWTNSGAFIAGTGSVELGGNGQFVAGTTTFNNLMVSGSYTAADCDITIRGDLSIHGSYAAGSGTHVLDGDLYDAGTLSSSGILTFTGNRVQKLQFPTAVPAVSTGTVNFNGTAAPLLDANAGLRFAHVNINNPGGICAGAGWTVHGNFRVAPTASFDGGEHTHLFHGTVTNSGAMKGSGTFNFSPTSDTTLALGSFASAGKVVFGGAQRIGLSSGPLALGSVEVVNTHGSGILAVSNWTLAGDLVIRAEAVFHAGTGLTHTIAGDLENDGTLDGGTSVVVFAGDTVLDGSGSMAFHHVKVTGALTNLVPLSLTGSFTNNGVFDVSGAELRFVGSTPAFIAGTVSPSPIDSLVIAKSGAAVMLAVNVAGLSSLNVAHGTLDTASYSLSQNDADGGDLELNAGGILRLSGGNGFPSFDAVSLDPASTVEFAGSYSQTVAARSYANVVLSGSGTKTLSSPATINGNLEINQGSKLNLSYPSGSYTPVGSFSLGGVVQVAGTWGSTSSSADHKTDACFAGHGKLNVGNRNLDHFAVSTPGNQTAGTAFTVTTITALDANNNTVTTFTGSVDITETGDGTGGSVLPSRSGAFVAGVLSGQNVMLTKAGEAVTITVSDHAGTLKAGTSGEFTVHPNKLDHFDVTCASPCFVSTPFVTTVTAKDVYGNTVADDSSTQVTNASSSANLKWENPDAPGDYENGLAPDQEYYRIRTLTQGVATFNTRCDGIESEVTLSSTSGPITGRARIEINSYPAGTYRSASSGNWASAETWEVFNGSDWKAGAVSPSDADGLILVQSDHTVKVGTDLLIDSVQVLKGGQLAISREATLKVGDAGLFGLEIYGTLDNAGTVGFPDANPSFVCTGGELRNSGVIYSTPASLLFKAGERGGRYVHEFAETAGTIPVAAWKEGSACEIAGYTSNTESPDGLEQPFNNIVWNCPNQTREIQLAASFTKVVNGVSVADTGLGAITLGSDLAIGSAATVNARGWLNCGPYLLTGGAFTLEAGGTLGIGSPEGITASASAGNIQTLLRSFSPDANYHYNGTTTQLLGDGLPTCVHNLVVANDGGITFAGDLAATAAFTVLSGSAFSVDGTLNGPLIVHGTIAPGNSVGRLDAGSSTWTAGGSYDWELNDGLGTPGGGWDFQNITGTLEVTATATAPFTINVITLTGSTPGEAAHFDNTQLYAWRIATASDGIASSGSGAFDANKFQLNLVGFRNAWQSKGSFSVTTNGNSVYLVYRPADCLAPVKPTWLGVAAESSLYMWFTNASGLMQVWASIVTNCTIKATAYDIAGGIILADVDLPLDRSKYTLPIGTTGVRLVAKKILTGATNLASVSTSATTLCGQYSSTDPTLANLVIQAGGVVTQRLDGLPGVEHYLQVLNGRPGLRSLAVSVNGQALPLLTLAEGDCAVRDLEAFMVEGENNTVVFTGTGEAGSSAFILLTDTPSSAPLPQPPVLTLALAPTGLELSWLGDPAQWQLLTSTAVDAAWEEVLAEPITRDGRNIVTLGLGAGNRFFRLQSKTTAKPLVRAQRESKSLRLTETGTPPQLKETHGTLTW